MKIGFVVTDLGLGGTQAWVQYASLELMRRGHEVCIIAENSPHDRAEMLRSAGAEVHAFDVPGSIADYAARLRQQRVGLIHLSVWQRFRELIRLRHDVRVPLAVSYQHVPKLPLRSFVRRLLQPSVQRWAMPDLFTLQEARRFVDLHIGCCGASAKGIRRVFWPFLQRRVVSLCNAVPLLIANAADVVAGTPHFLQVGALTDRKKPQMTLQAFPKVARKFPGAKLTFVGDGPLRADLERQRAENGIHGASFVGCDPDPGPYYATANVVVLPSLIEGLPYTLVEGAARGLPLIATRIDGNPEICRHDFNGLLVRPNDASELASAMLSLAASPERRLGMGARGRRLVADQFEVGQFGEKLVNLYRKMLRQSTGERGGF